MIDDSYSFGVSFIGLLGGILFLWVVWIAVRSQP